MESFNNGPLGQLFAQFSAFFPKFIGALSILFVGWIISRTVGKILSKILATIGVDRLAEMFQDIDLVQRAGGMRAPLRTIGIGAERHTAVGAGSTDLLARGSAPEQRGALRDRRVPPS